MPLISSFLGILVYMFKEKDSPHNKPHIHAVFAGEKISIASDGELGWHYVKMKLMLLGQHSTKMAK